MVLKAVILIGGPQKGTRFRPLSMEVPKPLFPVAGLPMIQHHIEACSKVPDMKEVIIIGFYPEQLLRDFISKVQQEFQIRISYLPECMPLGTAGGMYQLRDFIQAGKPELFFVMNADVCCDFPLKDMLEAHKQRDNWQEKFTMLTTESTKEQSLNYGCVVEDPQTKQVQHYVEKPETFVSQKINCGVYLLSMKIFDFIGNHANKIREENWMRISLNSFENQRKERIQLEQDIFVELIEKKTLYAFSTQKFWSQIKTAGAAVYANRHYLAMYRQNHLERLMKNKGSGPQIIGDVFIDSTARVDPSACLGPNVTIGPNVIIQAGVRVRESMVMGDSVIKEHSLIIHSIIGWKTTIGRWSRVEGTPNDPNPNKPFAKIESKDLFSDSGKLNPSITVIGSGVQVPSEVIILNTVVLPNKELSGSFKNQIIL